MKPKCNKFGCGGHASTKWLNIGESMQTANGFIIAKVSGWFCPICGGGYGSGDPPATVRQSAAKARAAAKEAKRNYQGK